MRVMPPGTVGSPGPGGWNGNGETNRVDCVRTVHKTVNVLDKLPSSSAANLPRVDDSARCVQTAAINEAPEPVSHPLAIVGL